LSILGLISDKVYYIGVDGATVGNDYTVAVVMGYDPTDKVYSVVDLDRK
jgi:hypothetical protein